MAKLATKRKTGKGLRLEVVNSNAAGIDISPKEMQVCVPVDRDENSNRKFGVYTEDLNNIVEWLKSCHIDTVAMESTGVYWLPIFRVLKESGFDVILVNASDVKNYSGRKTDASDAEWLMMLHSYGLLKPCFQPENIARTMRSLIRHRDNLIHSATREVLHLQKAMEQMNLKLDNVFSDILGKSGQAIIKAILDGERDPKKLSALADSRCKTSKAEIEKSLQATWDEEHLFEMKQSNSLYQTYQQLIMECDTKINEIATRYAAMVDAPKVQLLRSEKRNAKKNLIGFDVEKAAYELWGVNVMRIPGMSRGSLMRLLGELGADFTDKFPTVKHFVSWANLVPNNKISGGALLSSKVPKKKNPVGIVFRQAANTLKAAKCPLGDYFRHMRAKGGYLQAMVATGKKLATIFYTMIQCKVEYDEDVYRKHRKTELQNKVLYLQKRLQRMELELVNCG
ncbi:MAG: IS110 family transposase [Bacteroidaceae bacterium]|mgnify:FL=1|nr:IS110 family transposase [Bacteroidaceae bacterium]